MSEFYTGHKKHDSPTRRLMNQKDAACSNKSVINTQLNTGAKYSLTYCPSPDRAYVVEPHRGELNYDQAYKNLDKFYTKVMNQDITKHTIKATTQKFSKEETNNLKRGNSLEDASPVSKKSVSMSHANIANLGLNPKKRSKVEISTTQLSRGEMFDRLLVSITASIYKLVRERVEMDDENI